MKTALPALWAQAPATQRREPSASELAAGIPCGPADDKLFNEIFYRLSGLEKELANLLAKSGLNPDETVLTQVLQAVRLQKFGTRSAGGTANALTIALDPPIAAYADIAGAPLRLKLGAAPNSGAATLAVDGLPAKPILLADGLPLIGGELPALGVMPLSYDAGLDAFLIPGLISASFQGQFYGPDTGTANTIVVAIPRYGTTLVVGRVFVIKVAATSTSTLVQVNLNGIGNRTVKLGDGSAPPVGAIVAGELLALAWDGTYLQIVDDIAANFPIVYYGADSGTANALVASIPGYGSAYVTGQLFWVLKAASANSTTTPTINLNGIGAKTMVRRDGTAVAASDLPANALLGLEYDGTNVRLVGLVASDILAATSVSSREQVFFASATFTVPAGVTAVQAEVVGGGGGGGATGDGSGGGVAGNAGAGGGAGGYSRKTVTGLTPGSTVAVTVGSGGSGVAGAGGTNGGTSSFGAYCSASGGLGGIWGANTYGGSANGGTGTGGDINIPGGSGGPTGPNTSTYSPSYLLSLISRGGLPPRGFGTVPWYGTGGAGVGCGSGGNGGSGGTNLAGGAGAPGLVIIRW